MSEMNEVDERLEDFQEFVRSTHSKVVVDSVLEQFEAARLQDKFPSSTSNLEEFFEATLQTAYKRDIDDYDGELVLTSD